MSDHRTQVIQVIIPGLTDALHALAVALSAQSTISDLTTQVQRMNAGMAALDARIQQLIQGNITMSGAVTNLQAEVDAWTVTVAQNTSVTQSALALINGFSQRLADAIAAGQAAGASQAQLQAFHDLRDAVDQNDTALSQAVVTNTPAASTP